jgi:hypothetical protein
MIKREDTDTDEWGNLSWVVHALIWAEMGEDETLMAFFDQQQVF